MSVIPSSFAEALSSMRKEAFASKALANCLIVQQRRDMGRGLTSHGCDHLIRAGAVHGGPAQVDAGLEGARELLQRLGRKVGWAS